MVLTVFRYAEPDCVGAWHQTATSAQVATGLGVCHLPQGRAGIRSQ
jgi:hypothetical protein